jgi:transposase InsO family protein
MTLKSILKNYGIKTGTYYGWFKNSNLITERKKRSKNYFQILPEEVDSVVKFREENTEVGYRKLTWMLNDMNIAFLTESTIYRVLKGLNMLKMGIVGTFAEKEYSNKPKYVHHHWHTDLAYIKVRDIHYYLIMVLDGYSRFLLHWELLTDMTKFSVSMFIQETKEIYQNCKPMLIMDNGSQFISNDFKNLLSEINITPVHTRRNHPQTNGKIERMNGIVKEEAIRKKSPQSYDEACEILNDYQYKYNYQRLHSGVKYLRPADAFFGRGEIILEERKNKLLLARQNRFELNRLRESLSLN